MAAAPVSERCKNVVVKHTCRSPSINYPSTHIVLDSPVKTVPKPHGTENNPPPIPILVSLDVISPVRRSALISLTQFESSMSPCVSRPQFSDVMLRFPPSGPTEQDSPPATVRSEHDDFPPPRVLRPMVSPASSISVRSVRSLAGADCQTEG